MQIGVSSYSFSRELKRGMTYFEACDQAAQMGYKGIEFIDLEPQYGAGIEDIKEALVKKVKPQFHELNFKALEYASV